MNHYDFKNKNALITGGAQGFGLDIAKTFLKSGAKVTIWDVDKKQITKVKKKINSRNLSCEVVDVSSYDQVNTSAIKLLKKRNIHILINNAGITGPTAKLWNYKAADWHQVININLHGTYYCCKAIVPKMIKQNYGRIVNIASVAGKDGNANASAYSAAKAAVIGLTKSLGKETANQDIAVNCITPATAQTRILEQVSEEFIEYMRSKIPRGRFVKVEEIASLIAFLVSKENSFTTAGVFDISGGRATY